MDNGKDKLCLRCEHPKSEHVKDVCGHLDEIGQQPHGNREQKLCTCSGFRGGTADG